MLRLVLTGLLPVLVAVSSGAQISTVVTEAEFLARLDADHPAVIESAASVSLAQAALHDASTFDNPAIGIGREDPDGPERQTELSVSWQLPDLARRARIAAREGRVEAAEALYSQQLSVHRRAMRAVYADWALAAERRNRLAAQAARVGSLAERERIRAESGEVSGLEAHRLRLAARGFETEALLADAEYQRARAAVAAWAPDLPSEARPVLPEPAAAAHVEGVNPRLRAAEADLVAADLASQAAKRFVASPEVSIGWLREEVGQGMSEGPLVGLAWSIPLFDRRQGARVAAEADRRAAEARRELVSREVRTALVTARATLDRLTAALTEARGDLTNNERMLDGAEAAFRHGEISLTDLLATHTAVSESEMALLDLHEAALAAVRDLEHLTGSPDTPVLLETTTTQESDLEVDR